MSKRLKAALDFYLYGNLHIAFCAVAMVNVSCSVLHLPFTISLVLLSFFGTLSLYCFLRLSSLFKNKGKRFPGERNEWNFRNKKLLIFLTVISIVPAGYAFFNVTNASKIVLAAAGLISVLYSNPFLKIKGKSFNLRSLPSMKIFLIALVWVGVTAVLPVTESISWYAVNDVRFLYAAMYWWAVVFLLLVGLTIPFDVRDMEFDSPSIRSLPILLGEKQSVRFAQFLLVVSASLFYLAKEHTHTFSFTQVILFFLWAAFSIWALHDCSRKKSEYYFTFGIDGLMIVLWLFLSVERFV